MTTTAKRPRTEESDAPLCAFPQPTAARGTYLYLMVSLLQDGRYGEHTHVMVIDPGVRPRVFWRGEFTHFKYELDGGRVRIVRPGQWGGI